MSKVDLLLIAGNRPEIIKLSELIKSLSDIDKVFLYTGQHYSSGLKDIFLDEFGIQPDFDLRCGTSDVDLLRTEISKFLKQHNPPFVSVYGDTNTTYAGALAAKDVGSKLIHLEAGLRCFDRSSIEERNRTSVDTMSDILFAPSDLCKTFLGYERNTTDVHVTGNLIVDICRKFSKFIKGRPESVPDSYILLTSHRAENVDDPHILTTLLKRVSEIPHKIIFPAHPRTIKNIQIYGIKVPHNLIIIEPTGYIEFLSLLKYSDLVLTDSGGVQEEAVVLGKPCITLRNTTERWETILLKANVLFSIYQSKEYSLRDLVDEMIGHRNFFNPYGENVTARTKKILMNYLKGEIIPGLDLLS